MNITIDFLRKNGACTLAIIDFSKKFGDEASLHDTCMWWMEIKKFNWIEWLIEYCIPDKKTAVELAVFSSKLVLPIFENQYPNDNRPRKAIEFTEEWLNNGNIPTFDVAYDVYNKAIHAANDANDANDDAYSRNINNVAYAAAYTTAYTAYIIYVDDTNINNNTCFAYSMYTTYAVFAAFAACKSNDIDKLKIINKFIELVN